MRIEIDHDGYPTDASLEALEKWDGPLDRMSELLDAVADYFEGCGYGSAERKPGYWRLATGGWSGCESVLSSLPLIVRACMWQSSHRGGLHIFSLAAAKGE